jgi:2,4-dienoyl-CoA reductase-like NADH-dependent reductase (Old Yellow Enzyme family)
MIDIAPLLAPLTIRGLALANRVVMAPMTREMSPGGVPTPEVAAYYRRRAEGGVGLIITEGAGVAHPAAIDTPGVPYLHGDEALAGWAAVFHAAHIGGAAIIPQLWHQGVMRDAVTSPEPNVPSVRPSGIWGPEGGIVSLDADKIARIKDPTQPMTLSEIDDVVAAYAASARHAVAVGADGIALHAAHGYLIDTFLWHYTNRRVDRWGGDLTGRATFAAEVVAAIRHEIGPDRPIFFRFSQFKMQDYKARLAETPDEMAALLTPIAEAGVDVFDGSQRYFDTPIFGGSDLNLAGWAKKLTGKLGMAVGGVGLDQGRGAHHIDPGSGAANNLDRVMARFNRGEFDLIAVGRSLLNDARWLEKAKIGAPFLPFDSENLNRLT